MPQVLYIEWDAPDVVGELRRGLQDRLEGARGVHASFSVRSKARPGSRRSCTGGGRPSLSPDPASPTMRRIPARITKKKAPPPPLHELEAEVMEEVWAQGEAPVRSVMEALNKGSRK